MSVILAKVFGIYFLAFALLALFHPDRMKSLYSRVSKDENFLLYGALMALLIGAFIISVHNLWVWNWPVLLTIIGWWAVIKGYTFILYPEIMKHFAFIQNRSNIFYRILGVVWLILAAILIYYGWH